MIEIQDGGVELARRDSGTLDKQRQHLSVGQLELALLKRYPREDAETWDRMGLLVGDPSQIVSGVAVALDPTGAAIRSAVSAGANVLLTHHPAFLEPPDVFSPSPDVARSAGMNVYAAVREGVALINVHTALDVSVEATRMFPQMLNLSYERIVDPLPLDTDKGYGICCAVPESVGKFKLVHFAARATSVFGRPPRVWGDLDMPISRVVIANGSASGIVGKCLEQGVDCLLCGELRYHTALEASQAGLAIVEVGHDVSEFPLCALLAQAAVDAGVPQSAVTVLDQSSNWRYPEAVRI